MSPPVAFNLEYGHGRVDARSLAIHRAIAEKLRECPELMEVAFDNLRRWSAEAGRAQRYLEEWGRLLERPLDEVLQLMVEDSEWMRAMRQAGPFAGVLSPKERWAIYDQFAIRTGDRAGPGILRRT
jgi:hypothetical protein